MLREEMNFMTIVLRAVSF